MIIYLLIYKPPLIGAVQLKFTDTLINHLINVQALPVNATYGVKYYQVSLPWLLIPT